MAIAVEPALSPHLVVDDAAAAIDFYVKAFGAVEVIRLPRPDGKLIHASVRINGFLVMLNDDFPEMSGGKSMTPPALGGTPVTIHLTVPDVDAVFQRALDAGATQVMPLEDQFWGDRLRRGRRPVRPPLVTRPAHTRGQPRRTRRGDGRPVRLEVGQLVQPIGDPAAQRGRRRGWPRPRPSRRPR